MLDPDRAHMHTVLDDGMEAMEQSADQGAFPAGSILEPFLRWQRQIQDDFNRLMAVENSPPPGSPSVSHVIDMLKQIAVDAQDRETIPLATTQATELKELRAAICKIETKVDAIDTNSKTIKSDIDDIRQRPAEQTVRFLEKMTSFEAKFLEKMTRVEAKFAHMEASNAKHFEDLGAAVKSIRDNVEVQSENLVNLKETMFNIQSNIES